MSGGIDTEASATSKDFDVRVTHDASGSHSQRRLSLEEVYPEPNQLEPALLAARSLLGEYVTLLERADSELADSNPVLADEIASRAHLLLPELFCCRDLGDGFAASILALFHSVRNLQGAPLGDDKMRSLRHVASTLLEEPYLSFERSIGLASKLESVGFCPDPERLGYIHDAFESRGDDE